MPYVDNSGVDIHYHVEGNGPPLVVQHGLTGSLKNWYAYGFVEKLQNCLLYTSPSPRDRG